MCAGAHEHFVYVCGDQKSTLGIAFQESFTPGPVLVFETVFVWDLVFDD